MRRVGKYLWCHLLIPFKFSHSTDLGLVRTVLRGAHSPMRIQWGPDYYGGSETSLRKAASLGEKMKMENALLHFPTDVITISRVQSLTRMEAPLLQFRIPHIVCFTGAEQAIHQYPSSCRIWIRFGFKRRPRTRVHMLSVGFGNII